MNAKVETRNSKAERSSKADVAKLLLAIVLLVGAIVAFYYYARYMLLVRVLGLLAAVGVAVAIALQTQIGRLARQFVQESRTEVRKVVWPTRQETMQTTLAVVVMVIVVGILLWLLDMFLVWAVQLLTGQGG